MLGGKEEFMIQSIPHHLSNVVDLTCEAAGGTESLGFTDDVAADRSSRLSSKVSSA